MSMRLDIEALISESSCKTPGAFWDWLQKREGHPQVSYGDVSMAFWYLSQQNKGSSTTSNLLLERISPIPSRKGQNTSEKQTNTEWVLPSSIQWGEQYCNPTVGRIFEQKYLTQKGDVQLIYYGADFPSHIEDTFIAQLANAATWYSYQNMNRCTDRAEDTIVEINKLKSFCKALKMMYLYDIKQPAEEYQSPSPECASHIALCYFETSRKQKDIFVACLSESGENREPRLQIYSADNQKDLLDLIGYIAGCSKICLVPIEDLILEKNKHVFYYYFSPHRDGRERSNEILTVLPQSERIKNSTKGVVELNPPKHSCTIS